MQYLPQMMLRSCRRIVKPAPPALCNSLLLKCRKPLNLSHAVVSSSRLRLLTLHSGICRVLRERKSIRLMGKKRKSVASRLDEVDRTMYSTFCSAANSLSQLYTQAMNQQKLAFQAGERHALEKLYEWMIQQEGQGAKVSNADIAAYLQNELDHGGDEPPTSPRLPFPHQNPQPMMQCPTTAAQVSAGSLGQATIGHGPHQPKSLAFSNALSSPFHRNIQQYHSAYTDNDMSCGNGGRNNEVNSSHHQSRESSSVAFNDSSMDMNAETPYHNTYY